jgi:hypothetical protein
MPQITTRLSPKIRREFESYAQSLGLNGSALARLLIVRELSRPLRPYRGSQKGGDGDKLTAHFHSSAIVRRFQKAAKKGASIDAAAKSLFERELKDRWLWRALKLPN